MLQGEGKQALNMPYIQPISYFAEASVVANFLFAWSHDLTYSLWPRGGTGKHNTKETARPTVPLTAVATRGA
jgi:hypothetical protein